MIIKQIPSTYKLKINDETGLDKAMDVAELRSILVRNPELRETVNEIAHEHKKLQHTKSLAKKLEQQVYPNDLLDRAVSAVKDKDYLTKHGHNELAQREQEYKGHPDPKVATCAECGDLVRFERQDKILCWNCSG